MTRLAQHVAFWIASILVMALILWSSISVRVAWVKWVVRDRLDDLQERIERLENER